ncbi:MAG: hypothetical protein OHK0037_09800 [Elainellaceae cyanobacterium]
MWSDSSIERQQVSKDLQEETPGAELLSEANGMDELLGFKEFRESRAALPRLAGNRAKERSKQPTIENKSQ